MTDKQPAPKHRHGSENRQRNKVTPIRWTADEFNIVASKANEAGLTLGAFLRTLGLGDAGPRARRSLPVNDQLLIKAIGLLGKYGSNLNQIAYKLNANQKDALEADFKGALKDWTEIRDMLFEARGKEPSRIAPDHSPGA